jgi:DNA repair exonuclease SbcCD ATPase subunit
MPEFFVVALVVLAAAAFVAAPLLRGPRLERWDDPSQANAAARKQAALSALLDLEEERSVDKLSDADFELLRAAYEAEALAALRELDALGRAEPDDPLEAEIAELRQRFACPVCGRARPPGESCPECDG